MAVCASLRLHCGARSEVVPRNSLRSLRSLHSNSRGKSVDDARCARRPRPSAPRRHRQRPHRVPHAAKPPVPLFAGQAKTLQQRRVRAGWSAPLERRAAQGLWPRAQRASLSDLSQLFECSERSERSEFCDRATRPSSAGKSAQSADRSSEARKPARTRLCRPRRSPAVHQPQQTSPRRTRSRPALTRSIGSASTPLPKPRPARTTGSARPESPVAAPTCA